MLLLSPVEDIFYLSGVEDNVKITSPDMLAHSLKSARRQLQLTQQQAAAQVGIKQATISAFENHPEKSRIETLFKLLAVLELELHLTPRNQVEGGVDRTPSWAQKWSQCRTSRALLPAW